MTTIEPSAFMVWLIKSTVMVYCPGAILKALSEPKSSIGRLAPSEFSLTRKSLLTAPMR